MTKDGKRRLLDTDIFGMMNAEETRDFNKRLHADGFSMKATAFDIGIDWRKVSAKMDELGLEKKKSGKRPGSKHPWKTDVWPTDRGISQ